MADERNCTSKKKPPDATLCMNDGSWSAAVGHIDGFGNGANWDPWWGMTRSAHIKNAGLVIGYVCRNPHKTKGTHRWRLDYDDSKGIHLNEDWDNDSNTKLYHVINNLDAMPLVGMAVPQDLDEFTGTQQVLYAMVAMSQWHLTQGHAPPVNDQIIIGNKFGDVADINNKPQKWNALTQKILNFQSWDLGISPWTVHSK